MYHNLLLMASYQVDTGHHETVADFLTADAIAKAASAVQEPLLFAELQLLAAQRTRRISNFEASRDHLDKALIATFSLTGPSRFGRASSPRPDHRPACRELRYRARAAAAGRRRPAAQHNSVEQLRQLRVPAAARRTHGIRPRLCRRRQGPAARIVEAGPAATQAGVQARPAGVCLQRLAGPRDPARHLRHGARSAEIASAHGRQVGDPGARHFRRRQRIQLRARRGVRPHDARRYGQDGLGRPHDDAAALDEGSRGDPGCPGVRPGGGRASAHQGRQDRRRPARPRQCSHEASGCSPGAVSQVHLRSAPAPLARYHPCATLPSRQRLRKRHPTTT